MRSKKIFLILSLTWLLVAHGIDNRPVNPTDKSIQIPQGIVLGRTAEFTDCLKAIDFFYTLYPFSWLFCIKAPENFIFQKP